MELLGYRNGHMGKDLVQVGQNLGRVIDFRKNLKIFLPMVQENLGATKVVLVALWLHPWFKKGWSNIATCTICNYVL